jgi:hypothetical protein
MFGTVLKRNQNEYNESLTEFSVTKENSVRISEVKTIEMTARNFTTI